MQETKKKITSDPCGDLMQTAAPFALQQQGMIGIRGISPDDPRFADHPLSTPASEPSKVYLPGSCFFCAYLPEDPAYPPNFCPECGARFVPVKAENAYTKEVPE